MFLCMCVLPHVVVICFSSIFLQLCIASCILDESITQRFEFVRESKFWIVLFSYSLWRAHALSPAQVFFLLLSLSVSPPIPPPSFSLSQSISLYLFPSFSCSESLSLFPPLALYFLSPSLVKPLVNRKARMPSNEKEPPRLDGFHGGIILFLGLIQLEGAMLCVYGCDLRSGLILL